MQSSERLTLCTLISLKKRKDFIFVSRYGNSFGKGAVYVQAAPISSENSLQLIKFGFTISKKVGGAVQRNKVRRRFRVIAKELLPLCKLGYYYVFMGNRHTSSSSFKVIYRDLLFCLNSLKLYNGNNYSQGNLCRNLSI